MLVCYLTLPKIPAAHARHLYGGTYVKYIMSKANVPTRAHELETDHSNQDSVCKPTKYGLRVPTFSVKRSLTKLSTPLARAASVVC